MIDNKFSKEAIQALELDSPELEHLLHELETEIVRDIQEAVGAKFAEYAKLLNRFNHKLVSAPPEVDSEFNVCEYEHFDESDPNHFRIWLHLQIGAMRGYKNNETDFE